MSVPLEPRSGRRGRGVGPRRPASCDQVKGLGAGPWVGSCPGLRLWSRPWNPTPVREPGRATGKFTARPVSARAPTRRTITCAVDPSSDLQLALLARVSEGSQPVTSDTPRTRYRCQSPEVAGHVTMPEKDGKGRIEDHQGRTLLSPARPSPGPTSPLAAEDPPNSGAPAPRLPASDGCWSPRATGQSLLVRPQPERDGACPLREDIRRGSSVCALPVPLEVKRADQTVFLLSLRGLIAGQAFYTGRSRRPRRARPAPEAGEE